MRAVLGLLLTLALASGPLAASVALEVHLAFRGAPAGQEPVPVVVRAVPSSPGPSASPASPPAPGVEVRGTAPGSVRMELDGSRIWQISAQAESFWSAEVLASPSPASPTVTVDLWPAGTLQGSLQVAPGEKMPPELSIRFRTAPEKGVLSEEHTVVCPVVEGKWACQLPSRKLDLRLRARGFVSHYRWGVTVPAGGNLPLGILSLQKGASVVGRVEAEEGVVSAAQCQVDLSPMTSGRGGSPEDRERRSGLKLSAKVDERGFFHFEGVKPGSYVLSARQPGFAPAEIFPVSVLETSESDVRQPLLLRRPAALTVVLDPPLDPWNQPWRVLLFGRSPSPGSENSLGSGTANPEGRFTREGLAPGEYEIEVQDERGASFASQEVRLERDGPPVEIHLPLVWVAGTIRLGDEPLAAARLWFGGRNGRQSVLLQSGEEGDFEGALPREGDWEIDVAASSPFVERRLPKVSVRLLPGADTAKVTIDLPATHLSGEVVDAEGKRVPRASILSVDPEALHPVSLEADDEGRFELAGLPEGTLILSAKKAGLQSEEVAVSLSESSEPPPVRLVLRKLREVTGVLAAPAGGLPGVKIFAMAPDRNNPAALPASVHTTTDVEGRFRLEVPEKTTDLLLIALPPGYTLFARSWRGIPEGPLQLAAESQGGTLRLVPGSSGDASAAQAVVTVNGVFLDAILLGAWAALQGERNTDQAVLQVPQVPAGAYTACWVSQEEAWNAFRVGGFAATVPCASGSLSPGGELVLERPKAD